VAHAVVDHDELARRGQEYYDQRLRVELEPSHNGEFVVLDVESGDYELDVSQLAAMDRAEAKHPESVFYVLRVGHRTASRIGARHQGERT